MGEWRTDRYFLLTLKGHNKHICHLYNWGGLQLYLQHPNYLNKYNLRFFSLNNKHHILICIRLLKHIKRYLAVASITDGSFEVIMCMNATLWFII